MPIGLTVSHVMTVSIAIVSTNVPVTSVAMAPACLDVIPMVVIHVLGQTHRSMTRFVNLQHLRCLFVLTLTKLATGNQLRGQG